MVNSFLFLIKIDALFYEGVDLLVTGDFPASYKSESPFVVVRFCDSETPLATAPLIFFASLLLVKKPYLPSRLAF